MKIAKIPSNILLISFIVLNAVHTSFAQSPAQITLSHEPQPGLKVEYIPSQIAPPSWIKLPGLNGLTFQNWDSHLPGFGKVISDTQKPVPGGIELLGPDVYYKLHYRRAGAWCNADGSFDLRMETYPLVKIRLNLEINGTPIALSEFVRENFTVAAGKVNYRFVNKSKQIALNLELISPVSLPAYGMLGQVRIENLSTQSQIVNVIPSTEDLPKAVAPAVPQTSSIDPWLTVATPLPEELRHFITGGMPFRFYFNHNCQVLIGWAGIEKYVYQQPGRWSVSLAGGSTSTAFLSTIIASPGVNEKAAREYYGAFFDRNLNVAPETRARLADDAYNTFAGIIAGGEQAMRSFMKTPAAIYEASKKGNASGGYRSEPVNFELPDKKLESYLNLMANDYFPGLYQPPGLVHNSKDGALQWQYIFAYRHVHAACNLNLEQAAVDYLRILATFQAENGWLRGLEVDFKSPGHFTRWDASAIDAFHHYYKWTGDLTAVKELFPAFEKALGWIETDLNPDGDNLYKDKINQWKSDADNRGPSSTYQTAIVRKAYSDMAEFAGLLGESEKQKRYATKAEAIFAQAQSELWSDEFGMLGPKCPLGMLRLHPQSLEVEIPICTGLVDDYQAVMLADWYLRNHSFTDPSGSLWMFDNDWWPIMWSQHFQSSGDYMMVARALMQTGRFGEGAKILSTVAASSYRTTTPAISYGFDSDGKQGTRGGFTVDAATGLGAMFRTSTEGLFGIRPEVDKGFIVVRPRIPESWDHASFSREGLSIDFKRLNQTQMVKVKTRNNLSTVIEIPVKASVQSVRLNGKEVVYKQIPTMRHSLVVVETSLGGGTLEVITKAVKPNVVAPEMALPGEIITLQISGFDSWTVEDRFGFFEIIKQDKKELKLKLKRAGAGQAGLFILGKTGKTAWTEPVTIATMLPRPEDAIKRTVLDPIPDGAKFTQLDLSKGFTDNINACFNHPFESDADFNTGAGVYSDQSKIPGISFWTQPVFVLNGAIPEEVKVGEVPFKLGKMDSNRDSLQKNLILLANTAPREIATKATITLPQKKLYKIYLLSLNKLVPMKSYVPAAEVIIHYADGSTNKTRLVSPVNFDSYEQSHAVNTVSLPLPAIPGYSYSESRWDLFGYGKDTHLTMTDIICDPSKTAVSLEIRSIATETFMGVTGITLVEKQ